MGIRSLQSRFDERYAVHPETGCWLWTRAINANGYGSISIGGFTHSAHRIAYALHVGDITEGMYVLHTCDVRACVNPAHLFLGTQQDNVRDMHAKGRAHDHTKLAKAAQLAARAASTTCRRGHQYPTVTRDKGPRRCGVCRSICRLRLLALAGVDGGEQAEAAALVAPKEKP